MGSDGRATEWSTPAFFETGLMGAAQWKAVDHPDLAEDTTKSTSPLLRTEFARRRSCIGALA